jgi:hypothetical protein
MSARGKAGSKGRVKSKVKGAEPDEATDVTEWAITASALLLLLLILGAAGALGLGVAWLGAMAERYLGLGPLETTLALVGVLLLAGVLLSASRISDAVHDAIGKQTALLYELQDTLDRHADQVRELSEELGEADVLPELRRHGRARRRAGR